MLVATAAPAQYAYIYINVGVGQICVCVCVRVFIKHVYTTQPTNVCARLVTFCAAGGESLVHFSVQSVGGKTTSTALYRKHSISIRAKHCGTRCNSVSSRAAIVGSTSSGWTSKGLPKLSWKLGLQKPHSNREQSKGAVRNQERREMAKSDAATKQKSNVIQCKKVFFCEHMHHVELLDKAMTSIGWPRPVSHRSNLTLF